MYTSQITNANQKVNDCKWKIQFHASDPCRVNLCIFILSKVRPLPSELLENCATNSC
ncbi:hypothetical protein Mapa_012415 [Marchantia paleacea]|nr:hypothetical protein Mapa_012415 [Marchantia paleacea]